MTRSYCINFLLPLFLLSCVGGVRTDKVDFTQGFTDGNSKVWVVSKTITPDGAVTMNEPLKSDVYVFYSSGTCFLTDFQQLSQGKGRHGKVEFDHELRTISLLFDQEKRAFEFEFLDENHLMFYPLEGSSYTKAIELIPFPEFR